MKQKKVVTTKHSRGNAWNRRLDVKIYLKQRVTIAGLIVVAVIGLSGCEDIFRTNMFERFVPEADVSAMLEADDAVERIADAIESPRFIQGLIDDPEEKEKVVEKLTDTYNSPDASPEEKKLASLTHATIELETTLAGEVVDSFARAMMDAEEPDDDADPLQEVLKIFPDSATEDLDTFTETIKALKAASSAYTVYGSTIEDGEDVDGGHAQSALVAYIADSVFETDDDIGAFFKYYIAEEEGAEKPALSTGFFDDLEDENTEDPAAQSVRKMLEGSGLGFLLGSPDDEA